MCQKAHETDAKPIDSRAGGVQGTPSPSRDKPENGYAERATDTSGFMGCKQAASIDAALQKAHHEKAVDSGTRAVRCETAVLDRDTADGRLRPSLRVFEKFAPPAPWCG